MDIIIIPFLTYLFLLGLESLVRLGYGISTVISTWNHVLLTDLANNGNHSLYHYTHIIELCPNLRVNMSRICLVMIETTRELMC